MQPIDILHAEIEELQKRYWHCFNNWDCDEDLEKIHSRIEALKYRLSLESSKTPES